MSNDRVPQIGDGIYYYGPQSAGVPFPAIVMTVHSNELINIMFADGQRWLPKSSVHRNDSKQVLQNPNIATLHGAWAWKPDPVARTGLSEMILPATGLTAISPPEHPSDPDEDEDDGDESDSAKTARRRIGGRFAPKEAMSE